MSSKRPSAMRVDSSDDDDSLGSSLVGSDDASSDGSSSSSGMVSSRASASDKEDGSISSRGNSVTAGTTDDAMVEAIDFLAQKASGDKPKEVVNGSPSGSDVDISDPEDGDSSEAETSRRGSGIAGTLKSGFNKLGKMLNSSSSSLKVADTKKQEDDKEDSSSSSDGSSSSSSSSSGSSSSSEEEDDEKSPSKKMSKEKPTKEKRGSKASKDGKAGSSAKEGSAKPKRSKNSKEKPKGATTKADKKPTKAKAPWDRRALPWEESSTEESSGEAAISVEHITFPWEDDDSSMSEHGPSVVPGSVRTPLPWEEDSSESDEDKKKPAINSKNLSLPRDDGGAPKDIPEPEKAKFPWDDDSNASGSSIPGSLSVPKREAVVEASKDDRKLEESENKDTLNKPAEKKVMPWDVQKEPPKEEAADEKPQEEKKVMPWDLEGATKRPWESEEAKVEPIPEDMPSAVPESPRAPKKVDLPLYMKKAGLRQSNARVPGLIVRDDGTLSTVLDSETFPNGGGEIVLGPYSHDDTSSAFTGDVWREGDAPIGKRIKIRSTDDAPWDIRGYNDSEDALSDDQSNPASSKGSDVDEDDDVVGYVTSRRGHGAPSDPFLVDQNEAVVMARKLEHDEWILPIKTDQNSEWLNPARPIEKKPEVEEPTKPRKSFSPGHLLLSPTKVHPHSTRTPNPGESLLSVSGAGEDNHETDQSKEAGAEVATTLLAVKSTSDETAPKRGSIMSRYNPQQTVAPVKRTVVSPTPKKLKHPKWLAGTITSVTEDQRKSALPPLPLEDTGASNNVDVGVPAASSIQVAITSPSTDGVPNHPDKSLLPLNMDSSKNQSTQSNRLEPSKISEETTGTGMSASGPNIPDNVAPSSTDDDSIDGLPPRSVSSSVAAVASTGELAPPTESHVVEPSGGIGHPGIMSFNSSWGPGAQTLSVQVEPELNQKYEQDKSAWDNLANVDGEESIGDTTLTTESSLARQRVYDEQRSKFAKAPPLFPSKKFPRPVASRSVETKKESPLANSTALQELYSQERSRWVRAPGLEIVDETPKPDPPPKKPVVTPPEKPREKSSSFASGRGNAVLAKTPSEVSRSSDGSSETEHSWMPPSSTAQQGRRMAPVQASRMPKRSISPQSSTRSVDAQRWVPAAAKQKNGRKSARVDFTGSVTEEADDFDWVPRQSDIEPLEEVVQDPLTAHAIIDQEEMETEEYILEEVEEMEEEEDAPEGSSSSSDSSADEEMPLSAKTESPGDKDSPRSGSSGSSTPVDFIETRSSMKSSPIRPQDIETFNDKGLSVDDYPDEYASYEADLHDDSEVSSLPEVIRTSSRVSFAGEHETIVYNDVENQYYEEPKEQSLTKKILEGHTPRFFILGFIFFILPAIGIAVYFLVFQEDTVDDKKVTSAPFSGDIAEPPSGSPDFMN